MSYFSCSIPLEKLSVSWKQQILIIFSNSFNSFLLEPRSHFGLAELYIESQAPVSQSDRWLWVWGPEPVVVHCWGSLMRLCSSWLYLLVCVLPPHPPSPSPTVLSGHWSVAADQHGSPAALPPLPRVRFAGRPKVPVPSVLGQHVRQQRGVGAVWARPKGGRGR